MRRVNTRHGMGLLALCPFPRFKFPKQLPIYRHGGMANMDDIGELRQSDRCAGDTGAIFAATGASILAFLSARVIARFPT